MQGKVLAIIKSEDFIQLIRYGLIGILGLIVDFGIYSTLTFMTEVGVELANLISSSCGLINNFLWNSYANFKVNDHLIKRFVEYYIVGQITTIFTTICLFIFVSLLRQDKLLVKAISTIIATLIQFGINKAITFKKG